MEPQIRYSPGSGVDAAETAFLETDFCGLGWYRLFLGNGGKQNDFLFQGEGSAPGFPRVRCRSRKGEFVRLDLMGIETSTVLSEVLRPVR